MDLVWQLRSSTDTTKIGNSLIHYLVWQITRYGSHELETLQILWGDKKHCGSYRNQ